MRSLSLWGIIVLTGVLGAQPPQPTLPAGSQPPGLGPAAPQPPGALGSQPPVGAPGSPPTEPRLANKTIAEWVAELKDTDACDRTAACQAVALYGPAARKAALPQLTYLLTDFDHSVKTAAIIAVGSVGVEDNKEGREAVAKLKQALTDGQGAIRIQAALTLARLGPKLARSAVQQLAIMVRTDNGSWEIRKTAAFALGILGWDAENSPEPRAVGALAAAARDRSWQVRVEALHSLIHLGPTKEAQDTRPAIDTLTSLVQERSRDEHHKVVQIWARVALMRLDGTTLGEANLGPIAKALSAPEQPVRLAAAQALGTMGVAAKAKVPDLAAALQNTDPYTQAMALWALGQMGANAVSALPQIEPLTRHTDPGIKAYAEEAKRRISGGSAAPPNPSRPGGR